MLNIDHIKKLYTPDTGLKAANLIVDDGDIAALIGPNGSGKSTLLEVLCDVYRPDSGTCTLNGQPTYLCKQQIGFLPETPYLLNSLTGVQFLQYIAGMKGLSSFDSADRYIRFFQAETYATVKLHHLSQGQRKRIALIAALIGDPLLLVLDEPTNGLDTMTLLHLKHILTERKAQRKLTILSSHVLDFVANVATKIIFIKDGITLPPIAETKELENEYIRIFQD